MNTPNRWIALGLLALIAAGPEKPAQDQAHAVHEPPVPQELADAGTVYHTLTGREAQVTFTSDAPLENVVGKSNRVVGYAVKGPEARPAELAGARWVLPVSSLATGIPLRDKHLAGDEWLDAERFPTIEFELTGTEDAKLVKSGDGFSTWAVTLVGNMTVHGVTNEIRVANSRVSFLDESPRTAQIAKGDLMFIKSTYTVRLSDYDMTNTDIGGKVSDVIELSQLLRLSTVPPPSSEDEPGTASTSDTDHADAPG